jgi:hypothetical protein
MGYRFFSPVDWSSKVARFDQDTRTREGELVLTGDCPRCGHAMDVVIPRGKGFAVVVEPAVAGTRRRWPTAPSVPYQVTASCNCHMDHADRPDDVSVGCGAFGNLLVGAVR